MKAVMLSSVLFGLMHLDVIKVFYAAILGYIMALAVLATRTIWTAVIIHFMNNAIGTYIAYAAKNGWFGGETLTQVGNFIGAMFIMFILAFWILYSAIMAIIHKFARENYINDRKHAEEGAVLPTPHNLNALADNSSPAQPSGPPPNPHLKLRGGTAIKFYLTQAYKPLPSIPLRPIEKTLLFGIFFLGIVITGMTVIWGFL